MKVLIAEDDLVSSRILSTLLVKWGHEVVITGNGLEAWRVLCADDAPPLAILDWMMPEMDGVEVCRRARAAGNSSPTYLILLTAKSRTEDLVEGIEAGADEFITKPFDRNELRARLRAGMRIVELQRTLGERVRELEGALTQVHTLRGLLPICSYCKNIRNDQNYWERVDSYIMKHTEAQFSHSVCPKCYEKVVKPMLEEWEGGPGGGGR